MSSHRRACGRPEPESPDCALPVGSPDELSALLYAEQLAARIRDRLGRLRDGGTEPSRQLIHRDFEFGGVDLVRTGPRLELWLRFGWYGVPCPHWAEVDLAHFRAAAEDAGGGTELCVDFILQELQEDLTGGPATPFEALGDPGWGVRYRSGGTRSGRERVRSDRLRSHRPTNQPRPPMR
ncbi:MAG TPA: hypothetical protein VNF75_01700 [Candidatus Dormibacteraeota bacterium]|nr:hypothetical protein [Candidatus Dormibacteraeota bacterium]